MRVLGALPGVLLVAWAVVALWVGSTGWATVFGLVGLSLLTSAALAFSGAWVRRASDVLVTEQGFRIEGGPHHGLTVSFAELHRGKLELLGQGNEDASLVLTLEDSRRFVLASTGDALERESLQKLRLALVEQCQEEPVAERELPPEAPNCPACGAPVAPTAEETTACGHCGKISPTAPEVRRRMANQQGLSGVVRENRRLVDELLRQPSAAATNIRIGLSAALLGLLVLLFIAGQLLLAMVGIVEQFSLGTSAVASLLLIFVSGFRQKRRFTDRQALQSLLALIGAQPPRRTGEPWGCRSCGAPLASGDFQLITCVFCGQQNVLGSPLFHRTAALAEEARRLEDVLVQRKRRTRQAIIVFWVTAPLAAMLSLAAVFFVLLALEHETEKKNCQKGEARACVSLAFSYKDEANLRQSLPLAAQFAERGCRLGDVVGCCLAREAREENWGPFQDPGAIEAQMQKLSAQMEKDCW